MKAEDIAFWILILLIAGLAIWKLIGSPTDTASLIAIALFVASSELLIWKFMFKIDKKTTIGFIKIKSELNNSFKDTNSRLINIEKLIKKK